jgi:hypothetical protein
MESTNHRESAATWTSLVLLGIASALYLLGTRYPTSRHGLDFAAAILIPIAAVLIVYPIRGLNRTLPEIHADIRSSKQIHMTGVQKICLVLAGLLCVAEVARSLS